MITLPQTRKGIFFGLGAVLLLVLLVSVFTMTEFFGLYKTPELRAAACPWSDGDATDTDGGSNGTYTFSTTDHTVSPTSNPGGRNAYDCTSSATSITTFIVPNGATLIFDTSTASGDYADIKFTNLTINNGGVVHSDYKGCNGPSSGDGYGPNSSNVCTLSATGAGEGSTYAGGGGAYGGDAGCGGYLTCATSYAQAHGSTINPLLFGSSGGATGSSSGGDGGGIIRIEVENTLTHNGTIRANGESITAGGSNEAGGGGSGGAIYIVTNNLAGSSGTFESKGGTGYDGTYRDGGGGSGGQISIKYSGTDSFGIASTDFDVSGGSDVSGTLDVHGDYGSIYVEDTTSNDVTVYYGYVWQDEDLTRHHWIFDISTDKHHCDSAIGGSASPSVTATGDLTFDGAFTCDSSISSFQLLANGTLTLAGGSDMTVPGAITLDGDTDFVIQAGTSGDYTTITQTTTNTDLTFDIPAADSQTWSYVTINGPSEGDFIIDDAAPITLSDSTAINANVIWSNLTDLTLDSGTSIDADTLGCYAPTTGDGRGPTATNDCQVGTAGYGHNNIYGAGGGGYGDSGAYGGYTSPEGAGGDDYGTNATPTYYGSSGGTGGNANSNDSIGGNGGGYVRLDVSGTLTNNGTISANGQTTTDGGNTNEAGGGGSGGSIYITTNNLAGSTGSFEAKGGSGYDGTYRDGGAGAGGRISIHYAGTDSFGLASTDFDVSGGVDRAGSTHDQSADPGTVYVRNSSANDVWVYHGFTWDDVDHTAHDWVFDQSATNQFCSADIGSGGTPSLSATGDLTFNGELDCGISITSLDISASGTFTYISGATMDVDANLTLNGDTTFNLGSGAYINNNKTAADITFDIPAGDTENWSGVTINGPIEGDFIIDDAFTLTLSNSTQINSNVTWTNLSSLTIDSGTAINTDFMGCQGPSSGDGYGPTDPGNVCTISTTGYGGGNNWGAGGGGHGSAGGCGGGGGSCDGGTAGATYDSATAPVLLGSSGGGTGGGTGGDGGGAIRIDVDGTFTLNGDLSADGGDVTSGGASEAAGGGSGGAIYITTNSIAGSSGTISALGGDGYQSSWDGGCGGGGRLSIVYYSDSSTFMSGLTAANTVTGGTGNQTCDPGTFNDDQLDDPPSIGTVTISPSTSVSAGTPVSVSVTATDDWGVDQIKIWVDNNLDGDFADDGELEVTCNYSTESPATCQSPSEVYSRTSTTDHAVKIEVTDSGSNVASDDSTYSFSVSDQTSSNEVSLERLKQGETTTFGLSFELSGPSTGTLDVSFPQGFVISDPLVGPTSNSACLSGATRVSSVDFRMTKTACSGTISFSGLEVTNPSSTGSYTITWTNDNGSGEVYIVDDDQVTINANVEQSMTFDLDLGVATTDDNSLYTLDLGILESSSDKGSDDSAVNGIWVDVATNATDGMIITVKSANAALQSTAVPTDEIASGAVSTGTEGYGICVSSTNGAPTATDGTLQAVTPFNSTCTSSSWTVGTLTGAVQNILNTAGAPLFAGRAQIRVAASISSTTPAHDDYADTLTFIATSTY